MFYLRRMIRRAAPWCAAFCLSAAPALADWRYDGSVGLAGQARVTDTDGVTDLILECGNGGDPSFFVQGIALREGTRATFVVDQVPVASGEVRIGFQRYEIFLDFPSIDKVVSALRSGRTLVIALPGATVGQFSLKGSSKAIGNMAPRGCAV
ncbi:hypothetical protein JANAI62_36730 [Jannaschia pagri]|uniref:Uncharacterized protein n=1 Tax=Jannaschia pagri TaxID=2829797 RepID=A0ABQ4NRZ5_9RHOB|nr:MULTISPECIES: hypothetical protein [unclassified Jannaschia]GIT93183.1 hypothetical protein JANAI61_36410 [Jannaschia sp. AI_61]GIT97050.1 hypothetical protein JANAI62_36730 [Jannaschia sp. AI_62]